MIDGRGPQDVARSLKRYVAIALGDDYEVRLSNEEGVFKRPFARVATAGAATYPGGGARLADVIQPYTVYAYPPLGVTSDDAWISATVIEDLLFQAFRVGVENGRAWRVPLYSYVNTPLNAVGTWLPPDFVRVSNLSTQSFVDAEESRLVSVACDLRLSWRRLAEVTVDTPLTAEVDISAP